MGDKMFEFLHYYLATSIGSLLDNVQVIVNFENGSAERKVKMPVNVRKKAKMILKSADFAKVPSISKYVFDIRSNYEEFDKGNVWNCLYYYYFHIFTN